MGMSMVYTYECTNVEDMGFYWRWIGHKNTSDILRASEPMEN